MNRIRFLLPLLLVVAVPGCNWEIVEPEQVIVYVPEAQFRTIEVGMSPAEVMNRIGRAVEIESVDNGERWKYGVFQGKEPSRIGMLFGKRPSRSQFCSGRVEFSSETVVLFEVDCSVSPEDRGP